MFFDPLSRRGFLQSSLATAAGLALTPSIGSFAAGQERGQRPTQDPTVKVLNPLARVPVSLIIDDSTCLVNLAHFGIPHFAEAFPDRYLQDWRKLPREIPDAFVREFHEWCREHGVKGKYSIVPYPACVGWVDRDMPGWSKNELDESLKLVREFVMPNWDIHPEMVTHTWVIDTKTGRPYPERTPKFMENWEWSVGKSADQIAEYQAYALRILKNAGLPCEGVTTPGGFGNRSLEALSLGTLQAVRDVFSAEIPHYFRHLFTDERSVAPRVEYASGLDTDDPKCVVSIIGCTGDWFGGWDGLEAGKVDQFITEGFRGGRMVQVIDKGEPAIMVSHWPGMYFNGERVGFNILKEVVTRLHARYDHLIWMRLNEIARYWAAKELTRIEREGNKITLTAPFASPRFTLEIAGASTRPPSLTRSVGEGEPRIPPLSEVTNRLKLKSGTWQRSKETTTVCFDLPKGKTVVELG